MATIIADVKCFRADRAWGALDLAEIESATVRLHWSDKPYHWHVNDGPEVFVVLDGSVEMRYRRGGIESAVVLGVGDIFVVEVDDEHVAFPQGEARVLVIEQRKSD